MFLSSFSGRRAAPNKGTTLLRMMPALSKFEGKNFKDNTSLLTMTVYKFKKY